MSGNAVYFEDCAVGDQHRSIAMTVDKSEIIEFATKWDPQPWHIDEALAAQSMFGALTACSAHIFSLFCVVSPQWETGEQQQVLASLGFDEMRMLKPLYAGDSIYCLNTIELARASRSKTDRGIVAARCELINQNEEAVFSILSTFLMATKLPASQ